MNKLLITNLSATARKAMDHLQDVINSNMEKGMQPWHRRYEILLGKKHLIMASENGYLTSSVEQFSRIIHNQEY